MGGGGTPRLWGVSSKLCLLRLCRFCFFVCQVVSLAPGSAVLLVLLPCSMVCFIICPLGFWPGKGCWRVWGPLNCLVSRQAVCDTYVNQVNKEKHHRFERANCGYSFLTSGFLAISKQVPPPEQESTLGASGYASLSDEIERAVPQGKPDDIEDKQCVQTKLSITFVSSHNIYKSIPYHLSIVFPINSNNPPLIFSKPTRQYQ